MSVTRPAVIFQHPRSAVTFDVPPSQEYPETAQSIRAAWLASNRERAELNKLVPHLGLKPHPRPHCLLLVPKGRAS